MGKFQIKIDVEPNDIPALDDAHKQDCADAINRVINSTFKYTLIFTVVVAAIFAAYSIFGLIYVLRMGEALPQLPFTMLFLAILIAVFEFVSGTMKRWALITEIVLHALFVLSAVMQVVTIIAVPFALYGVVQHIKLMTLLPHYNVISQLKGFPDFTPLPIGDVINKAEPPKEENKASEEEKKAEVPEKAQDKEKKEPVKAENLPDKEKETDKPQDSENTSEDISGKEKKEPQKSENSSGDDKPDNSENSPKAANNQPRSSGNSSKKNKKKKRKKSSK